MKNVFKTFGNLNRDRRSKVPLLIVALVAIIGFSMVTCDDKMPDNNGGNNGGGNGGGNGGSNNTPQTPTAYDFNISGTGTVYFDGDYKTITVTPKTGKTSGARTVYYEGTGSTEYPKTTNEPLFFGTYNVTFDVAAATGYNAASGLSAGTLTIADGTPTTPTGVTLAIASTTSIKVSWTTVPRATSYKVYYIKEGMEELALVGTVTTNSFTHSGLSLKLDDIYFYYITAINTYGVSDYSTFKSIVIAKPVAPNAVTATATSSTGISLQWSAVTGATGYKVRYNITNSSSGGAILPDTYTSTSTPLTGAQENTTYYFWVKAINPIGESEYSTVTASAKTFGPPNDLRITARLASSLSDWIDVYVTTYSIRNNGENIIILYTTDSPNNPKKFLDAFDYFELINLKTNYAYINNAGYNTTYYFWATKAHPSEDVVPGQMFNYYYSIIDPFNNPTGTEKFDSPYGYSPVAVVRVGPPPPPPPPTPEPPLPPAASTPPTSTVICSRCDGARVCGNCVLGMYETKYGFTICPICKGNNKCIRCNGLGKY